MPVPVAVVVVLMVNLAASTGKLDALLGDKDGLVEGGRGDNGGVPPEALLGLNFPAVGARGMPDLQCNQSAS